MDNVELLRLAATFPCDPRHKQLLLESAAQIERLQYAVGIAVFELNFVAEDHECDQCRAVATNIIKIAKGRENTND